MIKRLMMIDRNGNREIEDNENGTICRPDIITYVFGVITVLCQLITFSKSCSFFERSIRYFVESIPTSRH